jgi:hypothetical protein
MPTRGENSAITSVQFAALGQNYDTCKVLFHLGVEPTSAVDDDDQ